MSNRLRFLQLDVFAERRGGGNPLGVVFGAVHWSGEQMQSFARWTDLVETTFVLPPSMVGASYQLRIFTPHKEIPFAGHPTIGSAHAVLESGFSALNGQGQLVQQCGAGLLPIRADYSAGARELYVAAPAANVLQTGIDSSAELQAVLQGLQLGALAPAFVDGGRRWWVAELASENALRSWKAPHDLIKKLANATDSMGLCAYARSNEPGVDLVVRAFPAGVGIIEDPASGAANGLLAAYIAQAEPQGALARGYIVSQGREIGHDAKLKIVIESKAARDALTRTVWVGGRTQTVIDGALSWSV